MSRETELTEHCFTRLAPYGTPCGDAGGRCTDQGECVPQPHEPRGRTQMCPQREGGLVEARADLDQGSADCWVGPTWEEGVTYGRGELLTDGAEGVSIGAYLFRPGFSVKVQGYDFAEVLIPGCVTVDNTADRVWTRQSFRVTCNNVAFARVTVHTSLNGDL